MNSINQSKNRILYLDSLRAFAIICVVLFHICLRFDKTLINFNFSSLLMAFLRICNPLFFMISGALLIGKSNDNFISKRFSRVLKPYAFWVIIYFIGGVLLFDNDFSFNYFLNTLFANTSITKHFWFIWALLGGYLLIPIVNGFLKSEKEKGFNYLLIIFLILTALLSLKDFLDINISHFSIIYEYLPFGLTPMLYFLIGYYLNKKKFNMSRGKIVLISLVIIAIGYILELNYIHTCSYNLKFSNPHFLINYDIIIESIGVFLFFKYFDLNLISNKFDSLSNSKFIPIVRNLSGCSFGIYFLNYLIVRYMFNEGNLLYQFTVGKAYVWIPLTFIVIFLICWLIIYLMSKIPILKIGSGFK